LTFAVNTEYSLWLAIPCLILGAGYAMLLYFRERRYEFTGRVKWLLAALRTLSIFIISFLLLSPLMRMTTNTIEKPIIVVAQDNSQSLVFCKDSAAIRAKYAAEMKQLISDLEKNYDVHSLSFGDKIKDNLSFDYNDKQTDFSQLFDDINARYANRNVGAVIIASDGLYNKGNSPVFRAEQMKYPFYTIALGDTSIQKDIIVSRVNYNRISYLGNEFPLEIVVTANKCSGQKATLTVTKGNETLYSKTIDFNSPRYIETFPVQLEAKQAGMQHYRVNISTLENEISYANNYQDVFVEVLDGREKILILAGAPHPDVSALKQCIEMNKIYQVDEAIADNFNKPLDDYNMIILHQIPFKGKNNLPLLQSIEKQKIPVLFILGSSSDISVLNTMKTALNIKSQGGKFDEATPTIADDFALFTISDELKKLSADFPALTVPFGDYAAGNSLNVLFYQKIGSVQTRKPLVMFNTASEAKMGLIAGEGIWKWRLNNFLQASNQNAFNELIDKIIQYLSVKVDKGRFRINTKEKFLENEPVEFDAEVYNESYQLINDPEVQMTITNAQGKKFPFTFSRTNHAYHINAGVFPVGDYKFDAAVKEGGKQLTKSGLFTVVPVNVESLNLIADHQLLYTLASKHDGKMLYPGQLNQLPALLKARDDVKSIYYSKKTFNDLVNLFWVFIVIVLLLSAEWFIRKRYGAY